MWGQIQKSRQLAVGDDPGSFWLKACCHSHCALLCQGQAGCRIFYTDAPLQRPSACKAPFPHQWGVPGLLPKTFFHLVFRCDLLTVCNLTPPSSTPTVTVLPRPNCPPHTHQPWKRIFPVWQRETGEQRSGNLLRQSPFTK